MSLQLLAILTAASGMAMLALTHNSAAEYFMFSVLSALLLVCFAVSRLSVRALRVSRYASDHVFENDPLTIRLEVTNRGRFPRFLLDLKELLPPFIEADSDCNFVIPALWPNESTTISYYAKARKRGVYTWTNIQLSAADPFGIFQKYIPVEAPGTVTIYPRYVSLNGQAARSGIDARGLATGERARGAESGLDFYGIRDYRHGDELRRIHWPATAHHNRLTVIEFDRGSSENIAVVLDTKQGTDFGAGVDSSLETAVRAAASLLHWSLTSEGITFLACGSAETPIWATAERLEDEYELLEVLARVKADSPMPASALLQWAGERLSPGSNVVVITAAPDERLPVVINALRRSNLTVTVIVLDAYSFDHNAFSAPMGDLLEAVGAKVVELPSQADLRERLSYVLNSQN